MLTRWTQHLQDPQEKETFKTDIKSSRRVLERLYDMIEEDEKALDRSEVNPAGYNEPSWAYHQAHKNGLRQYINQMKTILTLDPKGN